MHDSVIEKVEAWTALNSQGQPTIACAVELDTGERGTALVPSGTSRGRHEATELAGGETSARPAGVASAVAAIGGPIKAAVAGLRAADQRGLDRALLEADGTPDKHRLGANAMLAVSLATAGAAARGQGSTLWRHVAEVSGLDAREAALPRPMISLLAGGLHAPGGHPIQDFLVIPLAASTISEALAVAARMREAVAAALARTGDGRAEMAPSGAFYNKLPTALATLTLLNEGAASAGLDPGRDVGFAIDLAAGSLYTQAGYTIDPGSEPLDAAAVVDLLEGWHRELGVVLLEDPFDDDDWPAWLLATSRLGGTCHLVGDDLFVTNLQRVRRGVETGAANAVLLKPNQCGTLTELLDVSSHAAANGYTQVVSQRSVETEDTSIADVAVGCGADQVKFGPLFHSERLAKYNRLLELEFSERLRLRPWRSPISRQ